MTATDVPLTGNQSSSTSLSPSRAFEAALERKLSQQPQRGSASAHTGATSPASSQSNDSSDDASLAKLTSASSCRLISPAVVRQHSSLHDCWTVVHERVYNLTSYLSLHPGGGKLIMKHAGGDATEAFEALYHSKKARAILDSYFVGDLQGGRARPYTAANRPPNLGASLLKQSSLGVEPNAASQQAQLRSQPKPSNLAADMSVTSVLASLGSTTLVPASKGGFSISVEAPAFAAPALVVSSNSNLRPFYRFPSSNEQLRLIKKTPISPDSFILTYLHVTPDNQAIAQSRLALPAGHHIRVSRKRGGDEERRSYSPVMCREGQLQILVKRYPQGEFSQFMCDMPIGQTMHVQMPFGSLAYKPNMFTHILCLACGTGIAPIWQLIRAIMLDAPNGDGPGPKGHASQSPQPQSDSQPQPESQPQQQTQSSTDGSTSASASLLHSPRVDKTHISLVYSNRTERDLLLGDELSAFEQQARLEAKLAQSHTQSITSMQQQQQSRSADGTTPTSLPATSLAPQFEFHPIFSQPQLPETPPERRGMIDFDRVAQQVKQLQACCQKAAMSTGESSPRYCIFVCGSETFHESVREWLTALQVPENRYHIF